MSVRSCRFTLSVLAVACPVVAVASEAPDYHRDVGPFLAQHCIRCHGPEQQKAGLRLDTLERDLVAGVEHAGIWEEARSLLQAGEMPPRKEPQPTAAELARVVAWIDHELQRAAEHRRGSGVVMRRLNRLEYANSLSDLLGVVPAEIERLPPDTVEEGFDNIGSALRISPLHMERYLAAAREVLDQTFSDLPEAPAVELWRFEARPGPAALDDPWVGEGDLRRSRSWDEVQSSLRAQGPLAEPDKQDKQQRKLWEERQKNLRKRPGEHHRLIGLQTAATSMAERHPRFQAETDLVHGGWTATESVTKRDIAGNPDLTLGFDRFRVAATGRYRIRLRVASSGEPPGWTAGPAVLEVQSWPKVAPLFQSTVIAPVERPQNVAFAVDLEEGQDFGLRLGHQPYPEDAIKSKHDPLPRVLVDWIEIEGPIQAFVGWPSPAQRRFVGEVPERPDAGWARGILERFAGRAWRGPVQATDIDRILGVFEQAVAAGDEPIAALKEAFAAVLCSPRFLYLVEPAPARGASRPLSDHEVASRLSYFLWRSMPDEALIRRAATADLTTPDVIAEEARRLLADPRSRAFVVDFADQWLDLRRLLQVFDADLDIYPDWDEELRRSMAAETRGFLAELIATDQSLLACLDADFTVLDARLAHHYGISGVHGDHLRRVDLEPRTRRGGLLTHASILTLTSNGTRTSPVHRGVFILERILGTPPPPPPPNAGEIANQVPGADKVTVRERLELHRRVPACAGCHQKIDPLGLALEQFNGIGRFRTHELSGSYASPTNLGSPIDASAQMPDGRSFSGVAELKRILLEQQRERFFTCIAEKMLMFALGRHLNLQDRPLVAGLVAALDAADGRPSVLIEGIVRSEAFRSK